MSPASKKKVAKKKTTKKQVTNKKATKKKVATREPAKKKAIKKKAVTAASGTGKKAAAGKRNKSSDISTSLNVTPEERWKMIAVAAYHKAEKRGFVSGHELDDWTEAENEINKILGS
ncbi:MAG: DUF2934 domain-containing protein [Thioalkalispiraceae bacterium]|jgi:hypothetical protein